MNNKTKWQNISAASFFGGFLFQMIGWITNSWFFILGVFVLWGIALWCVIYRPLGAKND